MDLFKLQGTGMMTLRNSCVSINKHFDFYWIKQLVVGEPVVFNTALLFKAAKLDPNFSSSSYIRKIIKYICVISVSIMLVMGKQSTGETENQTTTRFSS